jgi:hypothetical protein
MELAKTKTEFAYSLPLLGLLLFCPESIHWPHLSTERLADQDKPDPG